MAEIQVKQLEPRLRKQYENAKLAIDRGNFEYTIEICSGLLLREPGCIEARQLLRRAQQRVYAAGGNLFRSIVGKVQGALLVLYGQPYLKKEPIKAMGYGERALAKDPFNDGALSLVAGGAERLNLPATAVFCLASICERGTKNVGILVRYCEALIKEGETTAAIQVADRLRKMKPESGAIQELVKSASVAHSINKGKWAEEKEDFRSKLKSGEEAERLERKGRLALDGESIAQSIKEVRAEIQIDPQNLDLYKQLARLLVSDSNYKEADRWLGKALHLPQGEGDLALRQLRGEVAVLAKEKELEELSSDKSEKGVRRIQELEADLEEHRLSEARKLVEQFPNDYGQRMRYGELLLKANCLDEAIQQFQVSQRSSNLKLKSHVLLGRSFMAKRLYDLALEQLDTAIKATPSMDAFKKEVVYYSAECCERLGRKEDAIRRYKSIYASDISFRDVAAKINSFYEE